MGTVERRIREREALRTKILEAARDILSEEGLAGLSMRAIADRVEYSPGAIYLYFRDKDELVGEVIRSGLERMGEYLEAELAAVGSAASALEQHRALGRAYARFALDNTAYFRVMFELPGAPNAGCVGRSGGGCPGESGALRMEAIVQKAIDEGLYGKGNARVWTLVAWGVIHGLTSLYLSGHLVQAVAGRDEFMAVVEEAMDTLGAGMRPRETQAALAS